MTRRIRAALAVATAMTALGLAGCGTTESRSAADDVPSLRASLSKVDAAMASRRYPAAQKALQQLIADVRRAREAGDLDEAAARDIVAAARRLLKQLEPDAPAPEATTDTTDDHPSDEDTPGPTGTPSGKLTPEPTSEPTSGPTSGPRSGPTSGPTAEPTGAATADSSDTASPGSPASSPAADLTAEQTPASAPTSQTASP